MEAPIVIEKEGGFIVNYDDPETEIYYTLDGSEPTKENGILYTGGIIEGANEIKVVAYKDEVYSSVVLYKLNGSVHEPILSGTLYRSTHTGKQKRAFQKEDERKICVFTTAGTKKDCDETDEQGKFELSDMDLGQEYIIYSSSKKKVSKKYFYKRMALYKRKYESTFGNDWVKKFISGYRIKKAKDNNYKTDLTYYRKYKVKRKVEAGGDLDIKVYMR